MSPAEAEAVIGMEKKWRGANPMTWVKTNKKKHPPTHSLTAPLANEENTLERIKVTAWYKPSKIQGAPDSLSFSLMADNIRILGADDGGLSRHINKVGDGHQYHKQIIPHPHLHLPVDQADLSGYAIPIQTNGTTELWQRFIAEARITEAPTMVLPSGQQMEMPL